MSCVLLGTLAGMFIKLYDDVVDGAIDAPYWMEKLLKTIVIIIVIISCIYYPTCSVVIFVFLGLMALIDLRQKVMDDSLWWEMYAAATLLLPLGTHLSILDVGWSLFIAGAGLMFQVIENNIKTLDIEFSITKVLWRLIGGLCGFFVMYIVYTISNMFEVQLYPLAVMMWLCGASYALTGVLVVMVRTNNGSNETSILLENFQLVQHLLSSGL